MNRSKPWYTQYLVYKQKAEAYLKACKHGLSGEQLLQLKEFRLNSLIKLIFESNTIESAGTKTFGETKRIFDEVRKKYKLDEAQFALARQGGFFSVYSNPASDIQVAKYGKSFKEYKEVMQHLLTFISCIPRHEAFQQGKLEEPLLTVEFMKSLHKTIANGLLDEGLEAGELRKESRSFAK